MRELALRGELARQEKLERLAETFNNKGEWFQVEMWRRGDMGDGGNVKTDLG